MNENKDKTDKNEHENGKRSKAGAGEAKQQNKVQNMIRSPQRFILLHIGPWAKFEELATLVLHLSRIDKNGPLKKYPKKRQIGPP